MRKSFEVYMIILFFIGTAVAQQPDSPEYEKLKKEGKLDFKKVTQHRPDQIPHVITPGFARNASGGNHQSSFRAQCNCLFPLDTSFHVVPFTNGTAPYYRNDDGSSPLINLPFTFNFYGTSYTSVFINNNGNITFNRGLYGFIAGGFPAGNDTVMIAPFWADVDTRAPLSGLVYYKITSTAMIVKWDTVGYFSQQDDKLNTFQLIITNGTDPILPPGNNVDFCYGDMQWTTGSASGGINGFEGTAANVGANLGNRIDYIQFGRFDEPGTGYDGPFGANDSVDFLDNQNFIFNTFTSGGSTNIPPIVHGVVVCDTITICADNPNFADTIPITLDFLAPEAGQITTINPVFSGPGQFSVIVNTPGPTAHIEAQIILNSTSVGINSATFIATDNGTPPATDSLNVTFKIDTFPLSPPQLTGSHFYCVGGSGVTLHINNAYSSYLWNTGVTGIDSIHVLTGTYNVEVTNVNGCRAKAPAFPVWELDPSPVIGGVTALCGQPLAHLTTLLPYVHYNWSNGDTTSTINVGTGTYTVSVTDNIGCTATSPSLTVATHPNPSPNFTFTPANGLAGDTIHFNDLSTAGSGSIVSWHWDFGDNPSSTSNLQNPIHVYALLGTYPVTLTVTQSDGCTNTITLNYSGEPEAVVPPNIITPNGDGLNDVLFFKNLEFYPNSKLVIFNRWGKKVLEDNNYHNDWKGGDLSDGVYYFVLKIPSQNEMKGTLNIKR